MSDPVVWRRTGWILVLAGVAGSLALLAAQQQAQVPGAAGTAAQATEASHANAVEGDRLFHEKGCAYCHGATAAGTEKAPSLEKIGLKWTKAQIERQIRDGGANMPAFGEALASGEIESVADYLASMRGTAAADTARKPARGK